MLARRGWLTCFNDQSTTMIPFFVKVRSKDIVPTDTVDIDKVLTKCSLRWNLTEKEDRVDYTHYRFTANWDNASDPNAEVVGCDHMNSYIDYEMYKDGRMFVKWLGQVSGTLNTSDLDATKNNSHREFYIPYALPNGKIYNTLDTKIVGGDLNSIMIGATLDPSVITNTELVAASTDEYNYKISMDVQAPTAVADAADLVWRSNYMSGVDQSVISEIATDTTAYNNYINRYMPVQFTYEGRWKDITINEA